MCVQSETYIVYYGVVEKGIGRGELPKNELKNIKVTWKTETVLQMAYCSSSCNPYYLQEKHAG